MCNEITIKNGLQAVLTYHKERAAMESLFIGLPDGSSSLIKSLITLADPVTGIVGDISYNELARILTINQAPGRKNSGTPTKQAIRNHIKSIERECGEYFKVISEGQKLQFLFPEFPKIFNKIFENREVNIDATLSKTLENTEQNNVSSLQANTEVNIERNTPTNAVKNNIIYINNNKQTNTDMIFSGKKAIADDFYPDAETIEIALAKGYANVIEPSQIAAFIKHNKTNKTQWADYNPVYFRWLERHAEYQAQQKQKAQGQLRSNRNERRTYQKPTQRTALDQVSEHHGISCDSLWDIPNNRCQENNSIEGRLINAVDEANSNLWAALC
ncbi:hypothetical protein [Legionella sp.]|uniref:hypothetical protein n=1 Tax=Legionella sp. TaxID=459 RepID=UPI000CC13860|nr:hypothetical protein [Legionella sp.]PJE14481.1 MAG: hypothetical protein CK430_05260 [Legionella sp.]